jgi:hypothetical protein
MFWSASEQRKLGVARRRATQGGEELSSCTEGSPAHTTGVAETLSERDRLPLTGVARKVLTEALECGVDSGGMQVRAEIQEEVTVDDGGVDVTHVQLHLSQAGMGQGGGLAFVRGAVTGGGLQGGEGLVG